MTLFALHYSHASKPYRTDSRTKCIAHSRRKVFPRAFLKHELLNFVIFLQKMKRKEQMGAGYERGTLSKEQRPL